MWRSLGYKHSLEISLSSCFLCNSKFETFKLIKICCSKHRWNFYSLSLQNTNKSKSIWSFKMIYCHKWFYLSKIARAARKSHAQLNQASQPHWAETKKILMMLNLHSHTQHNVKATFAHKCACRKRHVHTLVEVSVERSTSLLFLLF